MELALDPLLPMQQSSRLAVKHWSVLYGLSPMPTGLLHRRGICLSPSGSIKDEARGALTGWFGGGHSIQGIVATPWPTPTHINVE